MTRFRVRPAEDSALEDARNEELVGTVVAGTRRLRVTMLDTRTPTRPLVRFRLLDEDERTRARLQLFPDQIENLLPVLQQALDRARQRGFK